MHFERKILLLYTVAIFVRKVSSHNVHSVFHRTVCQQCHSWCSPEQGPNVEQRIGKAGPRGPIGRPGERGPGGQKGLQGPAGPPGEVNMTLVEEIIDIKVNKAMAILRNYTEACACAAVSSNAISGNQDTDGWIVFQRRMDGSVDFYRNWIDYVYGFGNPNGEFWLGLEKLHQLTKNKPYKLRIDMTQKNGNQVVAKYSTFKVGPSSDKYRLTVSGYSGNFTDSLSYHSGARFTTKDADNDIWNSQCATFRKGGWWYVDCAYANLNGMYNRQNYEGVTWYDRGRSVRFNMRFTEMKIQATSV